MTTRWFRKRLNPNPPPSFQAPTNVALTNTGVLTSAVVGDVVGLISSVDADAGDTVTYTLQSNPGSKFSITGTQLKVAASLSAGTITITIRATDSHALTTDQNFDIVVTSAAAQTIDTAEAEILAAFTNAFSGWGAVSAWDTTTTVTTAAELQTAITAATTSGNVTKKTKIICDWDGISSTGADIFIKGLSARTDGLYDNGGALYIVANTGRTPALGDQVRNLSIRGVHWKGIGFARRANGARQDLVYQVTLENNTTFPALPVVMFEACIWGVGYWLPAQPVTEWCKSCKVTNDAPADVYFKDCVFNGVYDGPTGAVRLLRIYNCDFRQVINICSSNLSHTLKSPNYISYNWIERNTYRDHYLDATSVTHSDMFQTGATADHHLGYRNLYRKNIEHQSHIGDVAGNTGSTQGWFNSNYMSADNQFVCRDNLMCYTSISGFTWFSPLNTRQSYCDRTTFMRAGAISASKDTNQKISVDDTSTPAPPAGVWLTITNSIYAAISDTGGHASATGGVICDARNTSTVTDASQRPEAIFTNGASNFVRTAGKLSYTVANETGTRAQFVAAMWALFQPVTSGKGCPDPTGWF